MCSARSLSAAELTAQQQQLYQVSVLVDREQIRDAIPLDEALIGSGKLTGVDLARAWNFLGLLYEDAGEWMKSGHAFEEAARFFENRPEYVRDLANVLNNFLDLYSNTNQTEDARRAGISALHLFEQSGDHEGISKVCNNLAALELVQRHLRESRRYIQRAFAEIKLAEKVDEDELASVYSNEADLELRSNDASDALAGFEHALKLWVKRYGEDHPRTGIGHVLLGNAYAETGDVSDGLMELQRGIDILNRAFGPKNVTSLKAEMALANALDARGERSQAIFTRMAAQQGLREISDSQCRSCTISAEAFR